MISLTYLSFATAPLHQAQLEELLAVSRDKNAACDVTGLLLYADQQFIQTLEGDPDDVEATMARIRADPRHRGLDVTLVQDIESRFFPEWSMGFRALDADGVAGLPGFSDFLDPDSELYKTSVRLGHAGKFHQAFRDTIPPDR